MRIRMLKTVPGSIDGIQVKSYGAGKDYDLTATDGERSLATALVNAQYAEEIGEKSLQDAPQNKAMAPAQNKSTRKRG
jgi:hypothetical protein